MSDLNNYIADENPFGLAGPPTSFLVALYRRDADLVILPGLTQPVYRLARRVKRSHGLMTAALGHDSETARMIRRKLIPVTTILPTTVWGSELMQWLDDRDLWKVGGADKADQLLSENDAKRAALLKKAQFDDAHVRGSSAWHAMKMRGGERVFLPGTRPGAQSVTLSASA